MSRLSEIHFNYSRAIDQAKQLETISSDLKKAAGNTLNGIQNNIHQAWKSDSASQYLKKGDKIGGDIRMTAQNISNIARTIRSIAKRVRDAELDAWRIANERQR